MLVRSFPKLSIWKGRQVLLLLFSVEEGSSQISMLHLGVSGFRVPNTISSDCGIASAEVAVCPESKQITEFYSQTSLEQRPPDPAGNPRRN